MRAIDTDQDILDSIEKIRRSGALGRSPTYTKLLDYLAEKTIEGAICSEISVAVDVFDKDAEFDVSSDSTVRVYIYNLRKKLDSYYEKEGLLDETRLVIPKGEYRLVTTKQSPIPQAVEKDIAAHWWHRDFNFSGKVIAGLGAVLISSMIILLSYAFNLNAVELTPSDEQLRFWGTAFTDEKPIKVVIGDYYIFGESTVNDDYRLIREFSINSAADLEDWPQTLDSASDTIRFDLGLTYLPRGSAYALAEIVQVCQEFGKTVRVTMMSELKADDLREYHIFYIGYVSGMDVLEEYTFSASDFEVGFSYDELVDTKSSKFYVSSLIDAEEKRSFVDYGILSSYSVADGNRVVIIAGTRDAGLMEVSELAASKNLLSRMDLEQDAQAEAFFSVYEVNGFNLTNVNSRLISSQYLDSENVTRD